MVVKTATLIYFSATGTTRKILRAIARGMDIVQPQWVSLTRPQERANPLPAVQGDVLVIGTPVYEERVPPFVLPCLEQLEGHGQPAVLVAVYGNVGVGLTLHQLASLVQTRGFSVAGGASFVGEHSFSHAALPVAMGRPDQGDLQAAQVFGRKVMAKLARGGNHTDNHKINFPARLPLMARLLPKNSAPLFTHPPHVDLSVCVHCGACAKACPMGAIDETTLEIDEGQCVRCFACVKKCPTSARQITLKRPWLVRWGLKKALEERQAPQFYL